MIDISNIGLTEEVITLLEERARQRGVGLSTLVRELIHVGLSHDLAAEQARSNGSHPVLGDWEVEDVDDMMEPETTVDLLEPEAMVEVGDPEFWI